MRRTDEHYRRESDLTWGPEKAVAGDLAPRKGCGKTMDSTPFPGRSDQNELECHGRELHEDQCQPQRFLVLRSSAAKIF